MGGADDAGKVLMIPRHLLFTFTSIDDALLLKGDFIYHTVTPSNIDDATLCQVKLN
jgi:hypothetical protein